MRKKTSLAFIIGGILLILVSVFVDNLLSRPSDGFGKVQIAGILLGAIFITSGLMIKFASLYKKIALVLCIFGVILIGINIFGILTPLRNKAINNGVQWEFGNDRIPTVSYQNAIKELDKRSSESREDYARRLTKLIYSSTVHFWGKDDAENKEYNIILPFFENYMIYIQNIVNHKGEIPHIFCNPGKAITRGVGVCDQMAQIVVSAWDPKERKAHMVTLDNHVVSEVRIRDEIWWVLDADFDVVIDRSMKEIEANPEIVFPYYVNGGYSEDVASTMVSYYEKKGNYVITNQKVCDRETENYRAIWIIPFLLIAPYILLFIFNIAIRKRHNINKV